jgi:hypothetical protein
LNRRSSRFLDFARFFAKKRFPFFARQTLSGSANKRGCLRWRRQRIGEGQDGARMDDTRHGTLSLFAALAAATIPTCIYTHHLATNRRAMAWIEE